MNQIVYISVVSNAALVVFTFRAFDDIASEASRVWIFLCLAVAFALAMSISFKVFPDMPKKTEIQLQRQVAPRPRFINVFQTDSSNIIL